MPATIIVEDFDAARSIIDDVAGTAQIQRDVEMEVRHGLGRKPWPRSRAFYDPHCATDNPGTHLERFKAVVATIAALLDEKGRIEYVKRTGELKLTAHCGKILEIVMANYRVGDDEINIQHIRAAKALARGETCR